MSESFLPTRKVEWWPWVPVSGGTYNDAISFSADVMVFAFLQGLVNEFSSLSWPAVNPTLA